MVENAATDVTNDGAEGYFEDVDEVATNKPQTEITATYMGTVPIMGLIVVRRDPSMSTKTRLRI